MDEKGRDKERTLELHEIIGDVLRKSKEVILVGDDILIVPQSILTYRARALLFMYAQTYFLIVQSVTNTFIGWVDLELNMYYQMIVDDIKELLASNECKDFPGEFKPFNESIFPETGILKIGWRGFAPDCADFLSKAQQYFHDMPKPANCELDYEYISQKFSVIKDKAHEYASKAKRLCDEHNKKETTPPKESIIHKHKKPMEAGQEIKPAEEPSKEAKNVFKKDGDFWQVAYQSNDTTTIKDSKGMSYIARLLEKPNEPIAALSLANPKSDTKLMIQGKAVENDTVSSNSGKPQEIIDEDTLQSCQKRIIDIKNELADAEKNNDLAAQERLEAEKEQILSELNAARNLKGESRSFTDNLDKARKAVTNAIKRALENIKTHSMPLYQHLDNSIQRGIDFAYNPDRKIDWEL